MNVFFIFCAKYLFIASPIIAGIYFLYQPSLLKKQLFVFALIALPLIGIVAFTGNHIYNDQRPFVVDNVTSLIQHAPDNGFPSDHTLLASAVAVVLYVFNRRLGLLLGLIALLVGISRVYVGLHHPIDIVGSILISILVAVFVHFFLEKQRLWLQMKMDKIPFLSD